MMLVLCNGYTRQLKTPETWQNLSKGNGAVRDPDFAAPVAQPCLMYVFHGLQGSLPGKPSAV